MSCISVKKLTEGTSNSCFALKRPLRRSALHEWICAAEAKEVRLRIKAPDLQRTGGVEKKVLSHPSLQVSDLALAVERNVVARLASAVCQGNSLRCAIVATASCKYTRAEDVEAQRPRSKVRSML